MPDLQERLEKMVESANSLQEESDELQRQRDEQIRRDAAEVNQTSSINNGETEPEPETKPFL